jgi:nitrite reductase/ring-hydroxylating ferredoxin subunit
VYAGFKDMFRNVLLIVLLLPGPGCKKQEEVIPYVRVNLELYLSDPQFNMLNAVGGWVYVNGGSKGIIVYRKSNDEFTALDRHCTYQPDNACSRVSVDASQITAVDTCCGSKFLITDGSILNGPANVPLQLYQTSFDGVKVSIYN